MGERSSSGILSDGGKRQKRSLLEYLEEKARRIITQKGKGGEGRGEGGIICTGQ